MIFVAIAHCCEAQCACNIACEVHTIPRLAANVERLRDEVRMGLHRVACVLKVSWVRGQVAQRRRAVAGDSARSACSERVNL